MDVGRAVEAQSRGPREARARFGSPAERLGANDPSLTRDLREAGIVPVLLKDRDRKILNIDSPTVAAHFALGRALESYESAGASGEFYDVRCTITHEPCSFPVQLRDGHTYELDRALSLRPHPWRLTLRSPVSGCRLPSPVVWKSDELTLDLTLYGYLMRHGSFADLATYDPCVLSRALQDSEPRRPYRNHLASMGLAVLAVTTNLAAIAALRGVDALPQQGNDRNILTAVWRAAEGDCLLGDRRRAHLERYSGDLGACSRGQGAAFQSAFPAALVDQFFLGLSALSLALSVLMLVGTGGSLFFLYLNRRRKQRLPDVEEMNRQRKLSQKRVLQAHTQDLESLRLARSKGGVLLSRALVTSVEPA